MTNIVDIAREAGVSTATVSRVLNNPELVSEERRKQVEAAVEKLNYSPNSLARELVTKNTNVIGMFIPEITNTFAPSVIESFEKELNRYHYNIFLCITNANPETERNYIKVMTKKRVDGLAFLGYRALNSENNDLLIKTAKKTPVVMMDYPPSDEMYCVQTDEEQGAFLATEYLIKLGHQKIAFLNGNPQHTSYYYKMQGYERALHAYGIEMTTKYCLTIEPNMVGGDNRAREVLQMNDRPTAIFASGDQIAIGVYKAAYTLGLSIPKDLSVIGFSGSPISNSLYPPLTTVAQYAQEMGSGAAKMMMDLINKNPIAERRIVFEPKILERKSCRALK